MKFKPHIIITSIFLLSCSDDSLKTMDFNDFKIQVPRHWKELKLDACDSNAGIIVTKNLDSIYFDYGMYSNSLNENSIIIDRVFLKEILSQDPKIDTTHYIIVENTKSINTNDYLKSTVTYRNIDGYKAKMLIPKKTGRGITGIYINKIENDLNGEVKFNFFGENLTKESQKELLNAITTLKFKK